MANRLALVDDDQNILASVSLALEAEGYEVDTYFDSEQALIGLIQRPPALAILVQNCLASCARNPVFR